ncbi:MAG: hypothetical protein JXP34_25370 [Planctomycetes bacterium]|nr:hypothetical protein [Planctomycetota bacterium]
MSGAGKGFVIISFFLVIALVAACGYLALERKDLRGRTERLDQDLMSAREEMKSVQGDLAKAEGAAAKASAELIEVARERDSLRTRLDALAKEGEAAEAKVGPLQTALEQTKTLVKEKEDEIERKGVELQAKQDEIAALTEFKKGAIKDLEAAKADLAKALETQERLAGESSALHEKISSLEKELENRGREIARLQKLTSDPIALISAIPVVDGKVRDVRRDKDGELVFLSEFSGGVARDGMQFAVFRGDELVGRVEVIQMLNDMAGARIIYRVKGQEILRGDSVRTTY